MSYDIFIFCLTTAGVLGAAIFSYKIARSRVYPIGIIRRATPSQPVAKNISIKAYIDESGDESCRIDAAEGLGNVEETVAQYQQQPVELKAGVGKSVIIGIGAVSGRVHWHYVPARFFRDRRVYRLQQPPSLETEPSPTEKNTDPTLEKKVAEQGQALEALEQRLRRLEVQSVQSVLESQESDAPQAAQSETIH